MEHEGTIEKKFSESKSLFARMASSHGLISTINEVAQEIIESFQSGGTLYLCGNGGSAAEAQHIAAEYVGRFEKERKGYRAVALTTDTSALTAIANDYGFEEVFSRQVEALCRKGDILIGLSTSGNSPNVIRAVEKANELETVTIGIAGSEGGQLKGLCNYTIIIPEKNTADIQQASLKIQHTICGIVERVLENRE